MNFNEMYRVFVKQEGRARFQPVEETTDGIAISGNKIHNSFFTKENAEELAEELKVAGFETKVAK